MLLNILQNISKIFNPRKINTISAKSICSQDLLTQPKVLYADGIDYLSLRAKGTLQLQNS
ncbi:hypothetical protein EV06_1195 [Prochlorococcus sp. MIT 0602]|nr:hypothetical protein EV06_1195 [Prochlorococcus sp. MIT 0602]KGG17602.1 hypothetical protein EV07_1042 [Prochlorococcus sp. MIT 0603]